VVEPQKPEHTKGPPRGASRSESTLLGDRENPFPLGFPPKDRSSGFELLRSPWRLRSPPLEILNPREPGLIAFDDSTLTTGSPAPASKIPSTFAQCEAALRCWPRPAWPAASPATTKLITFVVLRTAASMSSIGETMRTAR